MRVEESIAIDGPPRADLGAASRTPTTTRASWRASPAGVAGGPQAARARARAISMRMQMGSAEVGGAGRGRGVRRERGDLAWTSVTGIDQRGRWRDPRAEDGRTKVTLRLR